MINGNCNNCYKPHRKVRTKEVTFELMNVFNEVCNVSLFRREVYHRVVKKVSFFYELRLVAFFLC